MKEIDHKASRRWSTGVKRRALSLLCVGAMFSGMLPLSLLAKAQGELPMLSNLILDKVYELEAANGYPQGADPNDTGFAPQVTEYTATAYLSVDSIQVYPFAQSDTAQVTVNGQELNAQGYVEMDVSELGTHDLEVEVTDGGDTNVYTLEINKVESDYRGRVPAVYDQDILQALSVQTELGYFNTLPGLYESEIAEYFAGATAPKAFMVMNGLVAGTAERYNQFNIAEREAGSSDNTRQQITITADPSFVQAGYTLYEVDKDNDGQLKKVTLENSFAQSILGQITVVEKGDAIQSMTAEYRDGSGDWHPLGNLTEDQGVWSAAGNAAQAATAIRLTIQAQGLPSIYDVDLALTAADDQQSTTLTVNDNTIWAPVYSASPMMLCGPIGERRPTGTP